MLGMMLLYLPEIDGVSSKISWVSHRKVDYRIMVPCFMETRVNLLTKEMSRFVKGNNV